MYQWQPVKQTHQQHQHRKRNKESKLWLKNQRKISEESGGGGVSIMAKRRGEEEMKARRENNGIRACTLYNGRVAAWRNRYQQK